MKKSLFAVLAACILFAGAAQSGVVMIVAEDFLGPVVVKRFARELVHSVHYERSDHYPYYNINATRAIELARVTVYEDYDYRYGRSLGKTNSFTPIGKMLIDGFKEYYKDPENLRRLVDNNVDDVLEEVATYAQEEPEMSRRPIDTAPLSKEGTRQMFLDYATRLDETIARFERQIPMGERLKGPFLRLLAATDSEEERLAENELLEAAGLETDLDHWEDRMMATFIERRRYDGGEELLQTYVDLLKQIREKLLLKVSEV